MTCRVFFLTEMENYLSLSWSYRVTLSDLQLGITPAIHIYEGFKSEYLDRPKQLSKECIEYEKFI